jgi:Uma2 family endonuclease
MEEPSGVDTTLNRTVFTYDRCMSLVIDDAWLPATLTAPPMTDEQFAEFCSDNPDYFFEMTADGEIIVTPPHYTLNGFRNAQIGAELSLWADRDDRGIVTDATGGFVLPNGARRSPDLAWTAKSRLPNDLEGFWHLSPDFIVELRLHSESLAFLRAKMREWIQTVRS